MHMIEILTSVIDETIVTMNFEWSYLIIQRTEMSIRLHWYIKTHNYICLYSKYIKSNIFMSDV